MVMDGIIGSVTEVEESGLPKYLAVKRYVLDIHIFKYIL
jgi:hypothetical protein